MILLNRKQLVSWSLIGCWLLLATCSPTKIADGGTETGNAKVAGVLYNKDGSRAAHAVVRFVTVDHNPRSTGAAKRLATVVDTAITNDTGAYKIDSLPANTYNVLGKSDSGLSYLDSVKVKADSQTIVPPDTIKAPGTLQGKIRLQPGDDARKVFILFMGTNTFTFPKDTSGIFATDNMADGTYRVRILTTLDQYAVIDTVLKVTAGKNDTLKSDIVLPYKGIPVPAGLKISYDTLKQIVNLSWNKPATGRTVRGYNIYRMNVDSNNTLATINPHLVADTAYSDSTGVQDQTYQYRVAAVDTSSSEGVKSTTINVKILSAISAIGFGQSGLGQGNLHNPYRIAVQSDGNICVVDSAYRRLQIFDTLGNFLKRPQIQSGVDIVGICISLHGDMFIANPTKVLKYSVNDSLLLTIDSLVQNVTDVTVDPNGIIYAVGQDANSGGTIWKFDSAGKFISRWTTDIHYQSICCGPDFNVYVGGNQFINIYSPSGSLLKSITISLNLGGQNLFSRNIRDIVITKTSEIIVTDLESDELFVLDKDGNVLTKGGHFSNLTGISLSKDQTLYGVEYDGDKILLLKY